MSAPEDVEYEEIVVTGLEIWFKNGQKYQATLVPPDTYDLEASYLQLTVYPYDDRCKPTITDINVKETVCISIGQWVQKYPVSRPRKVVSADPSRHNTVPNEFESLDDPSPELQA